MKDDDEPEPVPMNCSMCALWHEHDQEDLDRGEWPDWGECEAAETDLHGQAREESLIMARGLDGKHGYLVTHKEFECCLWVER